jgi:GTP-binding protein Era
MSKNNETTRCGFVAIIGPPNAGKSTLVNHLAGQKVSIVTHKAQTTRMRMRAVVQAPDAQIILVDTPGIFKPNQRLDHAMVREAWAGASDADVVLVMLDAQKVESAEAELVLAGVQTSSKPVVLALNKIDRARPQALLAVIDRLRAKQDFADVFMISATTGDGVDDLAASLTTRLPHGPFLYPEDQAADIPMQLLAAEITREKLFLRLHQELPYALTVEPEKWERKDDGSVRVSQVIYVKRDGQKGIILGKGGKTIGDIGAASRRELEELLGHRVHLFLFVKVRENWMDDPERYRMLGIDFKAK